MGTDLHLSNALLDFLGKFQGRPMSISDIEYYYGDQGWEEALGMPVSEAFSLFRHENLVLAADPATDPFRLANLLLSVAKLKALLKPQGAKISGKKEDLINRLLELNPDILAAALPNQLFFIPTEAGNALIEARIGARRAKRDQCESRILDYLVQGMTVDAIHTWNQYAEGEPFKLRIEGSRFDREVNILNTIKYSACSYLRSRLAPEEVDALRAFAAITHLCGKNLSEASLEKLRPDIESFKQRGHDLPMETAARMLTFFAIGQENLRNFKKMGYAFASTTSCSESCEFCKAQSGIRHQVEQIRELPHQECTHPSGCRCTYLMHTKG